MEILFDNANFQNMRNSEERGILSKLYFDNGCNEELYYLIISSRLLQRYTFEEHLFFLNSFIDSQFNNNFHNFLKQCTIDIDKYNYKQLEQLIHILKTNEFDSQLMGIVGSRSWADYRSFDELLEAVSIYLDTKSIGNSVFGILRKNEVTRNRTFDEQMLFVYLYRTFISYGGLYYILVDGDILKRRTFSEQILLLATYLESNGKGKIQQIILNHDMLKKQDCRYQLNKIRRYFPFDYSYYDLLDSPRDVLSDIGISKTLKLDQYYVNKKFEKKS